MEIKDAVAVVTGGASGLGLATTKALLDEGAKVVILDLPSSKGEDVAKELGDRARFAAADVMRRGGRHQGVRPRRDASARCASWSTAPAPATPSACWARTGVYPLDKFARIVNINLIGTFNVLRLGAERMVKTDPIGDERGVIINTASVAAFDGQIGQAAYSASKGGVVGMTLPIARDLADKQIRVVTIAPGLFDTPLLAGPARAGQGLPRRAGAAPVAAGQARASTAPWPCTSSRTRCSTAR